MHGSDKSHWHGELNEMEPMARHIVIASSVATGFFFALIYTATSWYSCYMAPCVRSC